MTVAKTTTADRSGCVDVDISDTDCGFEPRVSLLSSVQVEAF